MKRHSIFIFTAFAALLLLLALPGCEQPVDADPPPPLSGMYESVEALEGLAGIETGGSYTVILGGGIDISSSWGEINDAIQAAKKYVVLDLSRCNAESIEGGLTESLGSTLSDNDFNIIRYNPYITGIILPGSLKHIEYAALLDCGGLSSVILPEGLLTIKTNAFYNCGSLTTLTLPSSVTSIAGSAFQNCTGLTSISIPSGVTFSGGSTFSGCSSLTSVNIPDSVTSIESSVFSGCTSLTSISIPGSVISIGRSAFSGCSSLTSVSIPSGVTSIGDMAFNNCTSLTTVVFEGANTSLGSLSTFPSLASLKAVYPSGGAGTYTLSGGTWTKE